MCPPAFLGVLIPRAAPRFRVLTIAGGHSRDSGMQTFISTPIPPRRLRLSIQGPGRMLLLLAVFVLVRPAAGQEEDPDQYGPKPKGAGEAKARYEAHLAAHANDPEKLVLPGLLADRQARRVEVLAECTGLAARETVEFLLIDQGGSHGYESMLWSMARPSDVDRALEFIGLRRGAPVHPAVPRVWSDGDRVQLSVQTADGKSFPIEQLILDLETEKTLPEEGFVFAGSVTVPSADGRQPAAYAADVYDPRSVASIYNEATSVLDVPRRVDKGESYGRQVVNPDRVLAGGTLVTVVMTPARAPGVPDTPSWRLQLEAVPESTGMVCRLTDQDKKTVLETPDLMAVLEKMVPGTPGGAAPFLELTIAENLPLEFAQKTGALLAALEPLGAVRVRPPPRDHLFHRAFAPVPEWREPAGRPSQPWELHLSREKGKIAATLVRQEPVEEPGETAPSFTRLTAPLAGPDDLRARLQAETEKRLRAGEPLLPGVLFVFATPGITYGEMMAYVRPVQGTHGTVYVFLE